MNKKLTAKTQYLNAKTEKDVPAFSKAFAITPENDELLMKRGTIYAVFEVKGGSGYDSELITKVVNDILHDSYFQSENISPIQSLEKAISDVKDRISHLTHESIRTDDTSPEFSIISGVLWGNVMYIVQFGLAQGYLVREGEIKPINTISEGGYSAASGVVKDGDVVIFCSHEFGRKYPPDKLLSMAISEEQLETQESCILLKFILDTTFTPNEQIDFGLEGVEAKKGASKWLKSIKDGVSAFTKKKKRTTTVPETITTVESPIIKTPEIFKERPSYPSYSENNNVESLAPKTPTVKLKQKKDNFLKKPKFVIPLIALTLIGSIFWSFKNQPQETPVENVTPAVPAPVVEGVETQVVEEPDETVFYDLKIADAAANPNQIAVFNNVIVVTDNTTGKIFLSDQTTAKFDPETNNFPGISNVLNINGKLGFTDTTGYKVYDLANQKQVESYAASNLKTATAYLDFVYAVSGDKILRYSKGTNVLEESLWGQNTSFENARSLSVAFSIYLLTADGTLEKFTGGTKDSFEVTNVPNLTESKQFNDPVQVITDIDFDNVYVAEKGAGRIVSVDKEGEFVKEYLPSKQGAWKDIKSIGVTPDEKTLFVLTGSRVYKVTL